MVHSDKMTAEFRLASQKVLDDTQLTPNLKFDALMKLLKEHHIAYDLTKVKCDRFLVHKCNRGGLGLDRYTVHKCGANILQFGANKDKLDAAYAI